MKALNNFFFFYFFKGKPTKRARKGPPARSKSKESTVDEEVAADNEVEDNEDNADDKDNEEEDFDEPSAPDSDNSDDEVCYCLS